MEALPPKFLSVSAKSSKESIATGTEGVDGIKFEEEAFSVVLSASFKPATSILGIGFFSQLFICGITASSSSFTVTIPTTTAATTCN